MDIAAAQLALRPHWAVDRVYIEFRKLRRHKCRLLMMATPARSEFCRKACKPPRGASTMKIAKCLPAFRWNLQLLSYIALVVGAFLIYNTILFPSFAAGPKSESHERSCQPPSNSRSVLGEAIFIGITGALLGIPSGPLMASGAVKLMGVPSPRFTSPAVPAKSRSLSGLQRSL